MLPRSLAQITLTVSINPRIALLFLRTRVALGGKKKPPRVLVEEQQICSFQTAPWGFRPW